MISIDPSSKSAVIAPADHPGKGWSCWWYVRLDGLAAGDEVTLEVRGNNFTTPDRAMHSADGRIWAHTAPGARGKGRIVYRHRVEGPVGWFAWGPPYLLADAVDDVRRGAEACPGAEAFTLARSAEGRDVPALRITPPGGAAAAKRGVWVQARQHAWESGGSWVCRGFLEWLVSGDPAAAALRSSAEVVVVPVMDADNVERGAGGKQQEPRDHNRDWDDDPHWPEVRAAQERIRAMIAAGRFNVFLDLHNPGARNRNPFFYVPPPDMITGAGRESLTRFLAAARQEMTGPLAFIGETQETGPAYDPVGWRRIGATWVRRTAPDGIVATTLETTWNSPNSTPDNYRRLGRELGRAMARYLSSNH